MRNIKQALQEHKEKILEHYAEDQLLGVFVYGSQNYNIATENSDVDTKAILIPNIHDLVLGKPVSRELHLDNGEHCEVKDIREMIKMFAKQNINFIEILFTKYYLINPKYKDIWETYFIKNRELIAYMDMRQTLNSVCGQTIHTLKQKPENYKHFANGLRLYYFLKYYLLELPYENCINAHYDAHSDIIMDYKKGLIKPTQDDVDFLIRKIKWMQEFAEDCPKEPNKEAVNILQNGALALITNCKNDIDFYK